MSYTAAVKMMRLSSLLRKFSTYYQMPFYPSRLNQSQIRLYPSRLSKNWIRQRSYILPEPALRRGPDGAAEAAAHVLGHAAAGDLSHLRQAAKAQKVGTQKLWCNCPKTHFFPVISETLHGV